MKKLFSSGSLEVLGVESLFLLTYRYGLAFLTGVTNFLHCIWGQTQYIDT